ncbi:DNA double-strand break repair nuclease NurA [Oscillatoria sp. CS-180]|uniref:DNA double-strand break repair nuclease NurA n=1 Tax=Oscillatoria sp. CS-180 TaxID=3021720 RepID=UPI00232EBF45|nr:DNA double-strand break repair nuclease NurA [Oscillatoria sp. CS-180]MDB9525978.1 DNA double-strand break repair nuclease NurA [Oscillatoria sp. CS-180]
MPVSPAQIRAVLDEKRKDLTRFDRSLNSDLKHYRDAWRTLTEQCSSHVAEQLSGRRVGSHPLETFDAIKKGVIPNAHCWENREESLAWVRSLLSGITTFAVDGSQIFPSKDISVPIALVQIGWFENPHTADGQYRKDIELDILTPRDLQVKQQGEPVDRQVNIRRFEMEVSRLVRYMESCQQPERSLVLFDGSLVVTFADAFDPDSQKAYVRAMVSLLQASQAYQVPLVGYIDTSYARDLTTLLQHYQPQLNPVETIHDAQLLNPLMKWGDRTPLLRCDREGILDQYGDQKDQIVFSYLQTTRNRPPARLEMPHWLWEAGLAESVLDWVKAEVVVGGGYPYAIETADQTAVLQAPDRQLFYRILQDWADRESLNVQFSRKLVSKLRRR